MKPVKRNVRIQLDDEHVLHITVEVEGIKPVEQQTLDVGPDLVADVWSTYVEVMAPRKKEPDPEARRLIADALKVATADEIKGAIRGCRASRFHMGENDQRRKYNGLTQIVKGKRGKQTTRERIDFFLDIARKHGVQSPVTSADPARVSQAKRAVYDAKEFPGDEHLERQAAEARAWLESIGYSVEDTTGEDGRPWAQITLVDT